jgi:hypothetical protein
MKKTKKTKMMMMKMMMVMMLLIAFSANSVQAITVGNHSFELPDIPGTYLSGAPDFWPGAGCGILNSTYGVGARPPAVDGDQVIYMDASEDGASSHILQFLKQEGTSDNFLLAVNQTYIVKMWVGRTIGQDAEMPQLESFIQVSHNNAWLTVGDIERKILDIGSGPANPMEEITYIIETGANPDYVGGPVRLYIMNIGTDRVGGRVLIDNVSLSVVITGPRSVAPLNGADNEEVTVDLQWKAPLDLTGAADPTTVDFVVYCDPNEDNLNAATFDDHAGIDYFSDQAVTGVLANDPNQILGLSPDLEYDTTYYWRVDTRRDDAAEPNDVTPGPVWSFTTKSLDPVISNPVSLTVPLGPGVIATFQVTPENATSVNWYKDGSLTPLADGLQVSGATISGITEGTGTLTITGVTMADEGKYHCVASKDNYPDAVSTAAVLLTERLYGHWEFNGDLTDSVQDTYPGVVTHDADSSDGDPNFMTGHIGDALALIDTGAEVVTGLADFDFFNRGHTISSWAKIDAAATASRHDIVSTFDGTGIGGNLIVALEDNEWGYQVGASYGYDGGLLNDGTPVNAGQWQYFAQTYEVVGDVATRKLYVDGELVDTNVDLELSEEEPPDMLIFGWMSWNGSDTAVDNVKIYSYALDEWAIAQEYVTDDPGSTGPVCAERPAMDIAPVGALDCKVNMLDFAALAAAWLENGNVVD